MTRWNLVVSDETDKSVRDYLARTGQSENDLAAFVDKAMREAIFWATVDQNKTHNSDMDQEELQAAIDEAVDATRASRS